MIPTVLPVVTVIVITFWAACANSIGRIRPSKSILTIPYVVPGPKVIVVVVVVKNPSPMFVTVAPWTLKRPNTCPGNTVNVDEPLSSVTVTIPCPVAGMTAKELPDGTDNVLMEL